MYLGVASIPALLFLLLFGLVVAVYVFQLGMLLRRGSDEAAKVGSFNTVCADLAGMPKMLLVGTVCAP
eukprot:scaffold217182_cov18-Tisochrysis_lutea.AAC.1